MNFFGNINAVALWDGVKESMQGMKTVVVSPSRPNGIDFTFITPTLLGEKTKHIHVILPCKSDLLCSTWQMP